MGVTCINLKLGFHSCSECLCVHLALGVSLKLFKGLDMVSGCDGGVNNELVTAVRCRPTENEANR